MKDYGTTLRQDIIWPKAKVRLEKIFSFYQCQIQKCVVLYHINIFYSEDDGRYIADLPDLQYCSAVLGVLKKK